MKRVHIYSVLVLSLCGCFIIHELHLPFYHEIVLYVINAVAVVLFFFQFELSPQEPLNERYSNICEFDEFLEKLTKSIYTMASKGIGAIVILENQVSLDYLANSAVILNAKFTSELLESLFERDTATYQGAVIIRETTILSAATILPITRETIQQQLDSSMGTRHLAALGLSQITDALIIIVSEDTQKVSIARNGIMIRGIRSDRFKGMIKSVFITPKCSNIQTSSSNQPRTRLPTDSVS
ncbi:MAG: diadenylate cyclase [Parachlamydia sp.]|nr:diadenylate cyclase [Parachlamydia sp.]